MGKKYSMLYVDWEDEFNRTMTIFYSKVLEDISHNIVNIKSEINYDSKYKEKIRNSLLNLPLEISDRITKSNNKKKLPFTAGIAKINEIMPQIELNLPKNICLLNDDKSEMKIPTERIFPVLLMAYILKYHSNTKDARKQLIEDICSSNRDSKECSDKLLGNNYIDNYNSRVKGLTNAFDFEYSGLSQSSIKPSKIRINNPQILRILCNIIVFLNILKAVKTHVI